MENRSYLRIVTEDDEPLYINEGFMYEDLLKVVGSEYFWVVYEDDQVIIICNDHETTVTNKEKELILNRNYILDRINTVEAIHYKLWRIVKSTEEAGKLLVDEEKSYEKNEKK